MAEQYLTYEKLGSLVWIPLEGNQGFIDSESQFGAKMVTDGNGDTKWMVFSRELTEGNTSPSLLLLTIAVLPEQPLWRSQKLAKKHIAENDPSSYSRSWTDCFTVDAGDSTAPNTQDTVDTQQYEEEEEEEEGEGGGMDLEDEDEDYWRQTDSQDSLSGTHTPHHTTPCTTHHVLTVPLHRREARHSGDSQLQSSFRCRLSHQDQHQ
jgi:hypothetical protein